MTGKKQEKRLEDRSKNLRGDKVLNIDDEKIESAVAALMVGRRFSGPIPSPEVLAGYENIKPGFADRILSMAERQSSHRQALEKAQSEAAIRDSRLGVIFAYLIGIGSLLSAVVISIVAPNNAGVIVGGLLGVTGIGSIVGTFIYGTRLKK